MNSRYYDISKEEMSMAKIVPYELLQPDGPVALKEYILISIEKQRGCVFKFEKKEAINISSITFDIFELNNADEEIARHRYTVDSTEFKQRKKPSVFEPRLAVYIDQKCHAIKIQMVRVVSGSYVYTYEGNEVSVDYSMKDKWNPKKKEKKFRPMKAKKAAKHWKKRKETKTTEIIYGREKFKVRSKRGKKPIIIWFIAVFAVLLIIEVVLKSHFLEVVPIKEIQQWFIRTVIQLAKWTLEFTKETFIFVGRCISEAFDLTGKLLNELFNFIGILISSLFEKS